MNKGYPPSVRDICAAVNLKSTSSVHAHLESLEKNGYIRRDPTKSRTIEIIDDNFNLARREVVNVPILGRVAAGEPLLAVDNITGYFPIPAEFMPNEECFMLTVQGESMINTGIYNGDHVIVKKCNTAENSDIVVALISVGIMRLRMNTAKPKGTAMEYIKKGSFKLTSEKDIFMYSTVTKTAKPKDNDNSAGGSTTHVSSSGSEHGGGGGSF